MSSANEEVVMENQEVNTECSEANELTAKVAELQALNDKLQADLLALEEAKNKEIAELKDVSAQSLASEVAKFETELAEAAKKTKDVEHSKDEENNKLKAELEAANEIIAAYKTKEEEMAKKEKKMKRMASLIDAGFDTEAASATVDKFESLDDSAFDAMTSLFAGKMPPWLAKKEEEKETEEEPAKSSTASAIEALDQVEEESSINLSVGGSEESTVDSTRAALVAFVCSKLGKKNK